MIPYDSKEGLILSMNSNQSKKFFASSDGEEPLSI
jgi:hypothetical protein